MMEAVSGSVTAAGIYLKVAAGMGEGGEGRWGERGEVERERDGYNEWKDLVEVGGGGGG